MEFCPGVKPKGFQTKKSMTKICLVGGNNVITHSFLINSLNCASKDRCVFNNLNHLHFQIKPCLIALYLIRILKSIC